MEEGADLRRQQVFCQIANQRGHLMQDQFCRIIDGNQQNNRPPEALRNVKFIKLLLLSGLMPYHLYLFLQDCRKALYEPPEDKCPFVAEPAARSYYW